MLERQSADSAAGCTIAVMGAGAVGCYYGGMLARAGNAVRLIGRASHVAAVQRAGLRFETSAGTTQLPLAASVDARALTGAGIVLCCVKANDIARAAAQMAPHLAADAVVVSLQNGVDSAARLAAQLGREVIPAVVYVAAQMAGPGHVRHHGGGELVLGKASASAALAEMFAAAGVPTTVSGEVAGELWGKLIINCAYNALSAITRLPYARLVDSVGIAAVMRDIVDECLAVARADRVTVADDIRETVQRIARTMPTQFSSTAQDLARGKRSEIDQLNGYVLRRGQALGVATPVNRTLHALVRAIETGLPQAGDGNPFT